jgi:predicted nucleic acid-binding Zn ribbon protein
MKKAKTVDEHAIKTVEDFDRVNAEVKLETLKKEVREARSSAIYFRTLGAIILTMFVLAYFEWHYKWSNAHFGEIIQNASMYFLILTAAYWVVTGKGDYFRRGKR